MLNFLDYLTSYSLIEGRAWADMVWLGSTARVVWDPEFWWVTWRDAALSPRVGEIWAWTLMSAWVRRCSQRNARSPAWGTSCCPDEGTYSNAFSLAMGWMVTLLDSAELGDPIADLAFILSWKYSPHLLISLQVFDLTLLQFCEFPLSDSGPIAIPFDWSLQQLSCFSGWLYARRTGLDEHRSADRNDRSASKNLPWFHPRQNLCVCSASAPTFSSYYESVSKTPHSGDTYPASQLGDSGRHAQARPQKTPDPECLVRCYDDFA